MVVNQYCFSLPKDKQTAMPKPGNTAEDGESNLNIQWRETTDLCPCMTQTGKKIIKLYASLICRKSKNGIELEPPYFC